ncbi:exopolysaccharide biosynthesis polyprenyl glycosylphosphotransferase [candidate division KSB1 bacterium]|nr:exopolysaccharide biosynthesis polyprenyl glycosylphosphotransferase [candidate division KSB1 bacterium]
MLRKHLRLTPGVPLMLDLITIIISFVLTFPFRDLMVNIFSFGGKISFFSHLPLLPPILMIWTIVIKFNNNTVTFRYTSFKNELRNILKTVLSGEVILLMILYSFRIDHISRTFVWFFGFVNFCLLVFQKYFYLIVLEYMREKGYNRRPVLVVSDSDNSKRIFDIIKKCTDWGLDIVGFLDCNGLQPGAEVMGSKVLGKLKDLPDVLHSHYIEEVIFALPVAKIEKAKDLLIQCETEGVQTRIISDFFSGLVSHTEVEIVHGVPIISYSTVPRNEWEIVFKRLIDIAVSTIGLMMLSPIFLIISAAIKLTSKGPVFYRWKVVGLNKKKFTSYKFRTMVQNADELKKKLEAQNEMKGVVFKMKNDPRITPIGRFLRKFSLDELPQLFSVLKGDMSLVGPRPPLVTELREFKSWHRRKLSVKPGITCLWQCSGRNNISNFDEWVTMDLKYIDQWSLWLDFKILLKTIPAVLTGRGAS